MEVDAGDCVEMGYVASADALRHIVARDWPATRAASLAAIAAGERFGDPDLVALGLTDLGRALIEEGRSADGLGRLDEAMVAVVAGELSPVVTGFVYCGVIEGCRGADELARAGEWTAALADWCARQPDLVPFTGTCLLHRAEILQVQGDWDEALAEARRAGDRFAERRDRRAAGEAAYRCGELLRMRGDSAAAERAFRDASRTGAIPSPASRCCGWRRARPTRRAPRRRAPSRGRRLGRARPPAARAAWRSCSPPDDARGRRAPAPSSTAIAGRHGRTTLLAAAAQARGARRAGRRGPAGGAAPAA